jgi:hypothetical protein
MFLFSQNRLGGLIQKGFKILLAKQPVAIGRVDHHRDPAVIGPCSKSVLADTEHVTPSMFAAAAILMYWLSFFA